MDLPAEGLEPLRRSLHDAVSLTDSTMNRIRQLAHDLRPPALDALGLAPTLEDLCKNFGRRTHLVVEFESSGLPPLLDAVNICLYRFVQEGLSNVAQHANASRVSVTLEAVDSTVCVSVQDDGRGFSPAAIAQNQISAVGLLGMRERLELLGGRLVIHSSPGAGTRLTAFVPYDAPSQVLPDEEDE
jgi:two-component system sensor kinase